MVAVVLVLAVGIAIGIYFAVRDETTVSPGESYIPDKIVMRK